MTVKIVRVPSLTQVSESYTYIKFQNLFTNLSYWKPKSKELFWSDKNCNRSSNDIEVWRADSPDGINIAELFRCLS